MGYNLPVNGVYWGYNPLILTIDPNFLEHPSISQQPGNPENHRLKSALGTISATGLDGFSMKEFAKKNPSSCTLPETNSKSTCKMDGWKTIVSFWVSAYFQGLLLLVFRDNIS